MRNTFVVAFALLAGVGLGFVISRAYGKRDGLKVGPYFDVRSTAPELNASDPVRATGPIRGCGSQEIAFIQGDSTVRIYLVSRSKRKFLHSLNVKTDWFRSIWFKVFQKQSGSIGIVLASRSLLSTADLNLIPDGYDKYPSLFDRQWEYDLGKVTSITNICNEHVITNLQWKPGIETPALCYQFSRDKGDLQPFAMKRNILFSAIEPAMIAASTNEQNQCFFLVTVQVQSE